VCEITLTYFGPYWASIREHNLKKTAATVSIINGLDRNIKYISTLHGNRKSVASFVAR